MDVVSGEGVTKLGNGVPQLRFGSRGPGSYVRLNVSTLRFQVLLGPVPCNKMIHCCEQDNAGRQWSNLFTVSYE